MPPSRSQSNPADSPESHLPTNGGFRLVLMRHAKSDWSGEDVSDHDRPLNDRGLRDAPSMARWIAEAGLMPDVILCSSAKRTQQTAALMQSYWRNTQLDPATLDVIPELYLATPRSIFEVVRGMGPGPQETSVKTVLLLAHNPGISHAAAELVGHPIGMSTAAVVVLSCDIPHWSTTLTRDNTTFLAEMKPKSLGGVQR